MTGRKGVWYSQTGLGAATPVTLVAAAGTGIKLKLLRAIVMVDTENTGDKVSIQDTADTPRVFAKFGAKYEGVQEVDLRDSDGGSAHETTANKAIVAVFTGTTARYTIKLLVDRTR